MRACYNWSGFTDTAIIIASEPAMSLRLAALLGFLLLPLLSLAARPTTAAPLASTHTRLILVHGAKSTADDWTPERIEAVQTQAERARAWWADRLDEPAPPPLASVTQLSVADLHAWEGWLPPAVAGELAIYVVANQQFETLAGTDPGLGVPGRLIVIEQLAPGPLAALIAHEIGHAHYDIRDLHTSEVDIMAQAYRTAYATDHVGCQSLAALGRPCSLVSLPLLAAGP
jgi:hypothetical protein